MDAGNAARGETRVIRQAISCDICGTDMQQTTHWFLAYDQGAELRVSGWKTHTRLRSGAKHLCGQTCLHKLVDEFMARTLAARVPPTAMETSSTASNATATPARRIDPPRRVDASLGARTAHGVRVLPSPAIVEPYIDEYESSAQLIAPTGDVSDQDAGSVLDVPAFNSPTWRSDAWKRERERNARKPAARRSIA